MSLRLNRLKRLVRIRDRLWRQAAGEHARQSAALRDADTAILEAEDEIRNQQSGAPLRGDQLERLSDAVTYREHHRAQLVPHFINSQKRLYQAGVELDRSEKLRDQKRQEVRAEIQKNEQREADDRPISGIRSEIVELNSSDGGRS